MLHRCSLIIVFPWKLVNTILRQQHTPYNYHIPGVSPSISNIASTSTHCITPTYLLKVSSKSTKEPIHHILVRLTTLSTLQFHFNHSYKFILRSTPRMVPNKEKMNYHQFLSCLIIWGGILWFQPRPYLL
jgi:hypothetical protein